MEEDKLISFLMRKLEATYQYEPSSIRVTSLYRLVPFTSLASLANQPVFCISQVLEMTRVCLIVSALT